MRRRLPGFLRVGSLVACVGLMCIVEGSAMAFELTSSAFKAGDMIPRKHSCDGGDVSPPLSWTEPPAGTVSFAVIVDDPDAPAGTWVHWVVYDVPATTRGLPEGVPPDETLKGGGRQGTNSFRKTGHGGPCPPRGAPHRYFFKLYALDRTLGLAAGATKQDVTKAMEGHVKGQAELMGRYGR